MQLIKTHECNSVRRRVSTRSSCLRLDLERIPLRFRAPGILASDRQLMTMTHVLALDAGGTKTVCLLANEHGRVVASARAGGANLQAAGELALENALHDLLEEAIGGRGILPAPIR